jgi:hypothetical protein
METEVAVEMVNDKNGENVRNSGNNEGNGR